MKTTDEVKQSAAVALGPRQAEETPKWVETSVWTEHMWTALENGVKGGKWFSLIDKVWKKGNLRRAFRRVSRNKGSAGVDHVGIEAFGRRLDDEIERLHRDLQEGRYRLQPLKRKYISKAGGKGKRPLSIPTVRDRVVHTATRHVIEPIFEKTFATSSYGFRPERGCKDALREVNRLLKQGWVYVIDADLRKCFDTIPHGPLLERMREQVADSRLLELIESFLKQGIMEAGEEWEPQEGTPQGGPLSPLLANIYLNPLDWMMKESGHQIVRYADDLVILCQTQEEASDALEKLQAWVRDNGLSLHSEKTRTVAMNRPTAAFDFLGYCFYLTKRGTLTRFPRKQSMKTLRNKLRSPTKRCNGHSMDQIICRINPVLRGWYEYYKHSNASTFREVDQWVRMRLRSLLRKRSKRRGRGRGRDHTRWPNAYFKELGLFSLVTARELSCPSA